MKPRADDAIQVLHAASFGVLATNAAGLPGYPYGSILPFVTDEQAQPVFLVSGLAEHTQNLRQDPRASFLVWEVAAGSVLTGARATLVGRAEPFQPESLLVDRYLRYQPEAEQYVGLPDFGFWRLVPERLRYIAGFGRMGWIEGDTLAAAPRLTLAEEAALIAHLQVRLPKTVRLLGLDAHGADLREGDTRRRIRYEAPVAAPAAVEPALVSALENGG